MLPKHVEPCRTCASVHHLDAAQVQQLRVDARLLGCNNNPNSLMLLLAHCPQQLFREGFCRTTTFRHVVVRFVKRDNLSAPCLFAE
jgi:hypothetical protein